MPNFKWSEVVAAVETAVDKGELDRRYGFVISAISHSEHNLSAVCDPLQISSSWLVRVVRSVCSVPGKEGDCDNDKIRARELIRQFTNLGWLEVHEESDDGSVGLTYCSVTIPARYRSKSPSVDCELGSVDPKKSLVDLLAKNGSRYTPRPECDYGIPLTAFYIHLKNIRAATGLKVGEIRKLLDELRREGVLEYWRAFDKNASRIIVYDLCGSDPGSGVYDQEKQNARYIGKLIRNVGLRAFIGDDAFEDLAHQIQRVIEHLQLTVLNVVDVSDLLLCRPDIETLAEELSEHGIKCHVIGDKPYVDRAEYTDAVRYICGEHYYLRESNNKRGQKNTMKRAAKSLEVSNDLGKLAEALDTAISAQGDSNDSPEGTGF